MSDANDTTRDKQCIRCLAEQPLCEFSRDCRRDDGLSPYCRNCICKNPEKRRLRLEELASGGRRCTKCLAIKTPEEFHRSKLGHLGRSSRCKTCLAGRHTVKAEAKAKCEAERAADARQCADCLVTKSFSEFYEYKGKFPRICKACRRIKAKAYAQRHPELYVAACRKYQKANPEVGRTIAKRRKARRRGAGGDYTRAEWNALKAKFGHRCLMCGMYEPFIKLTADHVIPISKGGTSYIDNIQPLCFKCNCSKKAKTTDFRYTVKAKRAL